MLYPIYSPKVSNFPRVAFHSHAEVEAYVFANGLCQSCCDIVTRGYEEVEFGGKPERWPVKSLWNTSCGAEWDVVDEDEAAIIMQECPEWIEEDATDL